MRKSETYRNEIKSYIVRTGMTMTEVVDYLSDEYGWSRSVPNLSGKLKRGSLRYGEARVPAMLLSALTRPAHAHRSSHSCGAAKTHRQLAAAIPLRTLPQATITQTLCCGRSNIISQSEQRSPSSVLMRNAPAHRS